MSADNPYQPQIDELTSQIEENQALLDDSELGDLAAEEIKRLTTQKEQLEKAAGDYQQAIANADNSNDDGANFKNCIIEFRPGAGGDEAKIWASELQRMYIRFADQHKLKLQPIDDSIMKVKGTLKLKDLDQQLPAFEAFKYESGVHRVQRVPETESSGRIHTSTATVAVLPEVPRQAVEIRDEDLEWQFVRASGAGGQSVNKTSSAVRLTHTPTGIMVRSSSERKQSRNREIALEQLRAQLWEIQEEERLRKIGNARSAIGRARRSEKIRTYNFPQNRVTDHRINESWYNLDAILEGDLNEVIKTTWQTLEAEQAQLETEAKATHSPEENPVED